MKRRTYGIARHRGQFYVPFGVWCVRWAIGQVVKLKYGREHTSEALEIWAFSRFGVCSRCLCSAVFTGLEPGRVQGCSGVFTSLLCSFIAEHGHGKSLRVIRRQAVFLLVLKLEIQLLSELLNLGNGLVLSWADTFDEANAETKHMIIARLVERIEINHDYEVEIKFRISVEQYMRIAV